MFIAILVELVEIIVQVLFLRRRNKKVKVTHRLILPLMSIADYWFLGHRPIGGLAIHQWMVASLVVNFTMLPLLLILPLPSNEWMPS